MSTLIRLKKRLAKVEAEAAQLRIEISALEGVPAQVELPGLPPPPAKPARQPSVYEQMGAAFQSARRKKLELTGVEFVPDDHNEPAFVVLRFKSLLARCGGDAEVLFKVIEAYFAVDWPAKKTPPYPFKVFQADSVVTGFLDQISKESAH
jgi:hypothetical protein